MPRATPKTPVAKTSSAAAKYGLASHSMNRLAASSSAFCAPGHGRSAQ